MYLALRNEISKISKLKLFFIWLGSIFVIAVITGIVIMGLGIDGEIGEVVGRNIENFNRGGGPWNGWEVAAALFSVLFTRAGFLLFEAYLIASIIVDEFRKKTIIRLFSYPISKAKIIWSKIILVALISFIGQFSAHILIQFIINLLAMIFNTSSSFSLSFSFLADLLAISLATSLVGLLPFVFGMIKNSAVVTMLSGLFLASLISNSAPGMLSKGVGDSLVFIFLLSLVSIFIVSISVFRVSKKDIDFY